METIKNYQTYAPQVLRIGLCLVFLWFGIVNIINPEMLISYLPSFVYQLPVTATTFMIINGIIETVLSLLLLAGIFVRTTALLWTMHLIGIALGIGYNDIAIRDIGLAFATFAVFLHGKDAWCYGKKE